MSLVTRAGKGSALSWAEMDGNLNLLNTAFAITAAETAASVTPLNLGIPSHVGCGFVLPERYGAVGNGNAADLVNGALDTTAIGTAITIASATGTAILLSRKYIAVPVTASTQEGPMAITVAWLMQSNMHVVGEKGASITVANGISSDSAPLDFAFFFTNQVLSNISFRDIVFDMNGANNPISPGRLNNVVTTGASGTGTTATITFAAQPFAAPTATGCIVVVSGVTPTGYNTGPGGAQITASTTTSISYANATTGVQTVAGQVNGGYNPNFNQASIIVSGTQSGLAAHIDDVMVDKCTFKNCNGSSLMVCGQSNNLGAAISLTAGPAAGAVSATLSGNWANATGVYLVTFSDTEVRPVTLTSGATTATWQQGLFNAAPQGNITWTGTLSAGAVSATLNANWTNATGTWQVTFSDGEIRFVTLTSGATTATWTPALTGSTTTAATYGSIYTQALGKRWTVRKSLFLNNGLDHLDHTSVFGWCDELIADGNIFWSDTLPHTVGLTGASTSLEIHGSRSIFTNNIVYGYRNGFYVAANYSSLMQDITVCNNHFYTTDWGGILFRLSNQFEVDGVDIHDNHFYFDNYQFIGQNTYRAGVLFQGQYTQQQYKINNVKIHDNQFTFAGTSITSYGVRWETVTNVAGNVPDNLSVAGNQIIGATNGVYLLTNASNAAGTTEISRNQFINLTPDALANLATGINVDATGGVQTLTIEANQFTDNRAVATFARGVLLNNGTITDLFYGSNVFKGLTGASYTETGGISVTRSPLDMGPMVINASSVGSGAAFNLKNITGAGAGFIVQDTNGIGFYQGNNNTLNFNYGYNNDSDGYINFVGYLNSTTKFRNLHIADGKGADIAFFSGVTHDITGRGIAVCKRATSIETRASTTTLTNSTQLTYAIPAAGTYSFEIMVFSYFTTAVTDGITANVNYSGTFTAVGSYLQGYLMNGTTAQVGIQPVEISATVNNALAGLTMATYGASVAAATPAVHYLEGNLIATGTGTLAFAFAQSTSGIDTSNLGVGSYMTITQLS